MVTTIDLQFMEPKMTHQLPPQLQSFTDKEASDFNIISAQYCMIHKCSMNMPHLHVLSGITDSNILVPE